MDIYFTDFFEVDPDALEGYGAFDISLVNDLPLFVDPFLLFNSEKPEYRALHDEIIRYMRFLKEVSAEGPIAFGLIESWFTFREVKQNWLGYSRKGNRGHGLGVDFAHALHRNLHTVFRDFGEERITRSSHLEKLCLIRSGVGRDNISDFTTNLIKGYLANYTQRFARDYISPDRRRVVPLQKVRFNYETRSWVTEPFDLPYSNRDYVLLTPKDMLTKDETWINRPDLIRRFHDIANSLPNAVLRAQVNEYFLRVLPDPDKAEKREIREAIVRVIDRYPVLIDFYIRDREEHGDEARGESRAKVGQVEQLFIRQVRSLVHSLLEPAGFYRIAGDTYQEARQRIAFLKDVIENKGGHRIFYKGGKVIVKEEDVQVLFRLTWYATDFDVTREANDGRGPADFKISMGAADKTIVEFKLAKNTHLEQNLAKQAEIYEKASDTTHPSIKVIFYFTLDERRRVDLILKKLGLEGDPHIVLIDARADNKPSGSKAR
jgi:hypothetical protein